MLPLLKKILIASILVLSCFITIENSHAEYLHLHPNSSKVDVKKFQTFFKSMNIYKGDIDGNYENLKIYIANFQKKHGIIDSETSEEAGYVGKKTFAYFEKKYGEDFEKVYKKFFELPDETPKIGTDTYFVVSAYYSPLPGQKRYAAGSYAGDIRLNGKGTHGASGAAVHPGFIAAPYTYSFGTKIYVEGLGVGIVEDRGGAIVKAGVRGHEYDRLDIWMGYGDTGLTRALNWGKKTVKGKILAKDTNITMNFNIQNQPNIPTNILAKGIKPGSDKESIKEMQKLFYQAGLYTGKIDGKYSSFKKSILSFQINNKIIQDQSSYGAGYIGEKTIRTLVKKYPEVFILKKEETSEVIQLAENNEVGEETTLSKIVDDTEVIEKEEAVIILTPEEKKEIEIIFAAVEKNLQKKFQNDSKKILLQKEIIVKNLISYQEKNTNSNLKKQIPYLIELLKNK